MLALYLPLPCSMAKLVHINISNGGVPKLPIQEARIEWLGIVGDKQKDKRYHGGPLRAICIFSLEIIEKLQNEGHTIFPGSTGENLTISIDDFASLTPGKKIQIGKDVLLEITSYTAPCKTIKRSFLNELFIRISHKLYPGESRLYAKVLQTGTVAIGDSVTIHNNEASK